MGKRIYMETITINIDHKLIVSGEALADREVDCLTRLY